MTTKEVYRLRQLRAKRAQAEEELERLDEQIKELSDKTTMYERRRTQLASMVSGAFTTHHAERLVRNVTVKHNQVGPLGGISSQVKGECRTALPGSNVSWYKFVVNIYCDDRTQEVQWNALKQFIGAYDTYDDMEPWGG